MKKPTLQDRAEYVLTRALETGVRVRSDRGAERFGAAVGRLVRRPIGIRREVVDRNLRLAFPDASEEWIERTTREAYLHLGRESVAMIRLSHQSRDRVIDLTHVSERTWREFEEARSLGRGVLLVTGHYGNWESAAAAVAARGVPIDAIVKRQRNPLVDARLEEARRRLGIGTISMRDANRQVPRALARGGVVGIVGDQDAGTRGIWVPFFGVPASTFRGPAVFALRFDAPVFAAVSRRRADGRYEVEGERIHFERTGDTEGDVRRLTEALAAHLEREVRKDPSQYFWFHKRWKTRAPTEPGRGGDGINTTTRSADRG